MAALVTDRCDHLQVLAAVALGKRKADEFLPALRSVVGLGGAAPEQPAPAQDASPA